MPHILSNKKNKDGYEERHEKEEVTHKEKNLQKWESMDKNLTITISFRMPIFTWKHWTGAKQL